MFKIFWRNYINSFQFIFVFFQKKAHESTVNWTKKSQWKHHWNIWLFYIVNKRPNKDDLGRGEHSSECFAKSELKSSMLMKTKVTIVLPNFDQKSLLVKITIVTCLCQCKNFHESIVCLKKNQQQNFATVNIDAVSRYEKWQTLGKSLTLFSQSWFKVKIISPWKWGFSLFFWI